MQAEIGLQRGTYNMVPPSPGTAEEISFLLAATVNKDGNNTGLYHVMIDNGVNYGHTIGQI
eukprot:13990208-Heterocapsa_arctica.AAC.1